MALSATYPAIPDIPREAFDDPDELYKWMVDLTTAIRALQQEIVQQQESDPSTHP